MSSVPSREVRVPRRALGFSLTALGAPILAAFFAPESLANYSALLWLSALLPGFLLAYALPQDGIDEPMDYNNIGGRAAQPLSLGLDDFSPIADEGAIGTKSFDAASGVNTAVVTDEASQFPDGATLRAVGLQGYFEQDIMGEIVSLHTPSVTVPVTGDDVRRMVVDSMKCGNCHTNRTA